MVKVFLDPGHGGSDSGAVGNGLEEKDITLAIALKIKNCLDQEYTGQLLKLSRTTDKTVSLTERTTMANNWGAQYLISVHCNAGGGTGFESYIFNGSNRNKSQTNHLRSFIHDEIVKATSFQNRGKKEANFHMLRESMMPAILTENGFIDHRVDASNLKSDSFLTKIAQGHARGIAKAFGLKRRRQGKLTFYRIVTGSFTSKNNAETRIHELKKKGFSSFIDVFNKDGITYYRVITGSFQNRQNAETEVRKLKEAGFDSFIYEVLLNPTHE